MKVVRITVAACAAAVLAIGVTHAQGAKTSEQANVSGRWVMAVKGGPHGDTTMGLTLKQEGTKVTGTFASPHGDVPVSGEFADGALDIATVVTNTDDPNGTFKAKLKCDGPLAGYLSSQMGDMSFTAARAKDE
jgi:hypothetical protein